MAIATTFEQSFAQDLPELVTPWKGAEVPAPRILALNTGLARELGLDPDELTPELLAGSGVPGYAMAYAGHQFGFYSPRLGDGRALLLGELGGRDVHLKGSGRTPYARGGDGKAAVGPMLREYLVSEAMHALGIPTTRSLAVVATGEEVQREVELPGAVLVRVAASHIRVGTFEYAARIDPSLAKRLADHAMARHYPEADSYLSFYEAVVARQAALIDRWMRVGFIHGVMNTDNMAISGETIDYGPCAFMDAYDPATVFSSIDHGGRYAYGNQPLVAQWNLARFAETLIPLISAEDAMAVLKEFPDRLGFSDLTEGEDFTKQLRGRSDEHPVYIPRNHLVEEALAFATAGDMEPFGKLLEAVTQPFTERPGFERYAEPSPDDPGGYRTFCGT
jgi:uncharacterized protein YdiU (UPF0061 family)